MAAHPHWLEVPTLLPGLTPEQLIYESWAQKESRYRVEWRTRWLVLYRDHVTRLPVLCTYKEARCDWDWAAMPEPTERLELTGCSCSMQREPSVAGALVRSLSFTRRSNAKAAPARECVFHVVSGTTGTLSFAAETSAAAQKWVCEISRGIAEAAFVLGGVPDALRAVASPAAYAGPAGLTVGGGDSAAAAEDGDEAEAVLVLTGPAAVAERSEGEAKLSRSVSMSTNLDEAFCEELRDVLAFPCAVLAV